MAMIRYEPYAGIGSRETPVNVCEQMTGIAEWLDARGFTLRSGGARGADTAFQMGSSRSRQQIFLKGTATIASMQMAKDHHPRWHKCGSDARELLGRNPFQILGGNLDQREKSKFVCCWTEDGLDTGGTGTALRIAKTFHVPIFNLHDETAEYRLMQYVETGVLDEWNTETKEFVRTIPAAGR